MQHLKHNGFTETTFFSYSYHVGPFQIKLTLKNLLDYSCISRRYVFFAHIVFLMFHNSFFCTERVTSFSNQVSCQSISHISGLSVSVLLTKSIQQDHLNRFFKYFLYREALWNMSWVFISQKYC